VNNLVNICIASCMHDSLVFFLPILPVCLSDGYVALLYLNEGTYRHIFNFLLGALPWFLFTKFQGILPIGGVKHSSRKICLFTENRCLLRIWYEIGHGCYGSLTDRNSYIADRFVSVLITSSNLEWLDANGHILRSISVITLVLFDPERSNMAW